MTSARSTRSRWERAELNLPEARALRLAVVADTHSRPHAATEQRLRELAPNAILHAGDIGDASVLDGLARVAPVFAVRGNIDVRSGLPDVLTLDAVGGTDAGAIRILLVHIGLDGARIRADVRRLAESERAALVVCGHSHIPFIGRDRGLAVFNPGSIGPRRFQLPIVLGAIEVERGSVKLRHIDAESGARWEPPVLHSPARS